MSEQDRMQAAIEEHGRALWRDITRDAARFRALERCPHLALKRPNSTYLTCKTLAELADQLIEEQAKQKTT